MQLHKLQEIPAEQVTELFSRKFFSGENITMAFLNLKSGCVVPLHHHESEQFSYVIAGSFRFQIGGEEVIVKSGELVQIPPNIPHSAVALEDTQGIDVFSPTRQDWIDGTDSYLRK